MTKILDINSLREELVILAHTWSQRFQSTAHSWPKVRQHIMVVGACGIGYSPHGGEGAER
jgi:hypothetical protein